MPRPTFKQVLGEDPVNLHVQLTNSQYRLLADTANDNRMSKADVLRSLIDQWLTRQAERLKEDRID